VTLYQSSVPIRTGVVQLVPLVDVVTYPLDPTATYLPFPYAMAFQLFVPIIISSSLIFIFNKSSIEGEITGSSVGGLEGPIGSSNTPPISGLHDAYIKYIASNKSFFNHNNFKFSIVF